MQYKYEETAGFVKYEPVMTKVGRSIAREVDGLLKCIQGRSVPAGAASGAVACGGLTAPNSYKTYLYVSKDNDPDENVVRAFEKRTDFSLSGYEVNVMRNIESVGSDGVLLKIDIIGKVQSTFSKRIGIRYQMINNATKEVLFSKAEEMSSKLGAERVATRMAQNIAQSVDEMIKCLRNQRTAGSGPARVP